MKEKNTTEAFNGLRMIRNTQDISFDGSPMNIIMENIHRDRYAAKTNFARQSYRFLFDHAI